MGLVMARAKWFHNLTAATPLRTATRSVLAERIRAVKHFLRLVANRPREYPEHVHQLRVGTRRLAAALSVLKPCLDHELQRRLRRATRRLRRAAGTVRDLDVQRQMLAKRLPASVPARTVPPELRRLLDQRRDEAHE